MKILSLFRRDSDAYETPALPERPPVERRTASAKIVVSLHDGSEHVEQWSGRYVTQESWMALHEWETAVSVALLRSPGWYMPPSSGRYLIDEIGLRSVEKRVRERADAIVLEGVWIGDTLYPPSAVAACTVRVIDEPEPAP